MTSRRGVALLTALAMIVLISIAALERSAAARPQRLSVAAVADRAVLEAVATGGLEHARARLLELLAAGPMRSVRDPSRALGAWLPAEGMVLSDDSGELQYRVEVHDAGARLNLNAASQEQFRKLLLALRVDTRRADHLAAAFADWRDVDQLRRANGAEQPEYVEAGSAMLPDDGPFTNVGMLRFVIGMNDSLAALPRRHASLLT